MDIKKSDRATLKAYFVKNAVPSEGNFTELIDGAVNQKEDGIVKLPGQPLSVQAESDQAIHFYKSFAAAKPAWTLSINPGFSIGNADGVSTLFIDQATGNVGVGTAAPDKYRLNVNGPALVTGNYLHVNSDSAGRLRVGAVWGMPGLYSGDDGDKPLILGVPSGQKVYLGTKNADAWIEGGTGNIYFKGNVGIGTDKPVNKLQVAGNLHMDGNSIFLRGEDPKDQYDVIKWNKAGDRIDIGGYNGVALGHTRNTANSVNAVLSVDNAGTVQVNGSLIRKVYVATGLGPGDGTNNGQILSRVLSFTKIRDDTAIRIVYCDNFRVNGNDASSRWEIRIDGKSAPGGAIYQDKYGNVGNYHELGTIVGFATGVKAGSHKIEVWVGPAFKGHRLDAYTGWLDSRWTIEAEEVWTF